MPELLELVHWREPLWLMIALQPAVLFLLARARRRRQLQVYADPRLHPWVVAKANGGFVRRLASRDTAYVLAWLLLAVAAAGPRIALESLDAQAGGGMDLMLVVDVSHSMAATDVRPSRVRRAQIEIHELLQHARGDRVGIIVYAARAHLYVPPTHDHQALRAYLQNLDQLVLPTRGSQPAAALSLAVRALGKAQTPGAVVLVTDGDLANDKSSRTGLERATRSLNDARIPLYVLGVGTVEGAPLPLAGGGWLKSEGRTVVSRMNETALRALARRGNGRYSPVRDDASDWAILYEHGAALRRPPQRTEPSSKTIWRELYPYALLPAVLLLFVALMPYRLPRTHRYATSVGVTLLLMVATATDPARATERAAYGAYSAGDYAAARALYAPLVGYAGRMGEGASQYRRGEFAAAVTAFSQAVLAATTDAQRGRALYNLGNAYFQLGDYANAAIAYDDALLYLPQHEAARTNGRLAARVLREVRDRLGEQGATNRAGRGPRQARADRPMEIGDTSSVSLDPDEPEPEESEEGAVPEPKGANLESLVRRGLDRVRLVTGDRADAETSARPIPAGNLASAHAHMRELEDQQAMLWKRVFEIEEGFPGPVDEPKELPGVAPW